MEFGVSVYGFGGPTCSPPGFAESWYCWSNGEPLVENTYSAPMPSAIGAKDFTLIVSYMRYIFLTVMTANPLQDLVLVLLVCIAEVPIPRSLVALAASA